MLKKFIFVAVAVLVVSFSYNFYKEHKAEQTSEYIKENLFPEIKKVTVFGNYQCTPVYIVIAEKTLQVFCRDLAEGVEFKIQEKLRNEVSAVVSNWLKSENLPIEDQRIRFESEFIPQTKK